MVMRLYATLYEIIVKVSKYSSLGDKSRSLSGDVSDLGPHNNSVICSCS